MSLLRSARSGVALTTVMSFQQSPGVWGHSRHVPSGKPVPAGGMNLGWQDHMEVQSPGPPGCVLVASGPPFCPPFLCPFCAAFPWASHLGALSSPRSSELTQGHEAGQLHTQLL